jgi:hypothetical protein
LCKNGSTEGHTEQTSPQRSASRCSAEHLAQT